jgi:hypothetical protein
MDGDHVEFQPLNRLETRVTDNGRHRLVLDPGITPNGDKSHKSIFITFPLVPVVDPRGSLRPVLPGSLDHGLKDTAGNRGARKTAQRILQFLQRILGRDKTWRNPSNFSRNCLDFIAHPR